MLTGTGLIAAERARQIAVEDWSPEHDDDHECAELAEAAACYATHPDRREMVTEPNGPRNPPVTYPADWPWDPMWWKPTPNDRVRELVKAGALCAAEIDRLQRAEAAK